MKVAIILVLCFAAVVHSYSADEGNQHYMLFYISYKKNFVIQWKLRQKSIEKILLK